MSRRSAVRTRIRALIPYSLIAQLVEHTTVNRAVTGSSPVEGVVGPEYVLKLFKKSWHLATTDVYS